MKRSQVVSLALLAGAGAGAVTLAALDPSQDEEDVLVYPSAEACAAAALRTEADCRSAYALARAAYPGGAPHYATLAACEEHHGPAHCVSGTGAGEAAGGQYLPLMAGYVIGRTAAQALTPQPVFDHAPASATVAAAYGGYGGYCTGSGGRIWTAGGGRSAVARVASATVRPATFGGFGATGRSFGARASAAFGGG